MLDISMTYVDSTDVNEILDNFYKSEFNW
jgi:hypothetical protein